MSYESDEQNLISLNRFGSFAIMLGKVDLTKTADESTFDKTLTSLQERLGILQRAFRDQNIPTIIVIEGWNAAGITMAVHEIVQALDPRGFALHAIERASEEERARPFLWRFWLRTPPQGRIALFARSWYSRAISEEMQKHTWQKSLKGPEDQINRFERQLHDNGTVILKFFLHISKEEQKLRLEERERNPLTAWLVTPSIWNVHRHYDDSFPLINDFINKTNTDYAPWTVVEATDRKYTILKIYSTIVKNLEKVVEAAKDTKSRKSRQKEPAKSKKNPVERRSKPYNEYTREECQQTLNNLQIEMLELHYLLFKRKIPLMIAYEGWDAAGKGGNITRLTRFMNPLGYYVVPISAPTSHESQYHYLRRFIKHFPPGGDIAIFDRSWYGRVLVERVEGFCSEPEWQRAYQEINEMEEDFIYSSGGGIVKFWLEISKDEQLKRFQQRANDPLKIYKITEDDWRNRDKWDHYEEAVDEMLARTSTDVAPWTVIESDEKWYARVKAIKTVIKTAQNLL
ncbi:polyphosphate:AMP phosphotransferase [uncultured Methanoregula sp.]|uniref:polyphosphate:AMP phosphotransferase n=1 Tax=uncultured Methanoregula sp. TaxID=1005933 RepID=UPI002AAAE034|nr:polyphosphate:AMP phosphotransferase [uncultured Methanoregula sp.]